MKNENSLLFYFALVLLIASLVIFGVNVVKVTNITGAVSTSVGQANLTVETVAAINFTTKFIDWGSGQVNSGSLKAYLNTSAGTVANGNWTANTAGLVLENIGNVNVSLTMQAGKTAATFIGGTSPVYEWNFTNVQAGSCTFDAGVNEGAFATVSQAAPDDICTVFGYLDSADALRMDISITVPSDSKTGPLTDTITATATAI